jgi:hypothetical protein
MPNKRGKSTNKEERFFSNLDQGAYSAQWGSSKGKFKGKIKSIPGTNKGNTFAGSFTTKELKSIVARDRDSQRRAQKQGEYDGMSASFYKKRADQYDALLKDRVKKVAAQKVTNAAKKAAVKKAAPKTKKSK